MKTKKDGFTKAFDPYTQEEVELILSLAPTRTHLQLLAKVLGRSDHAIGMVYETAYSTNLLKGMLRRSGKGEAIGPKIIRAKEKLGFLLGHRA